MRTWAIVLFSAGMLACSNKPTGSGAGGPGAGGSGSASGRAGTGAGALGGAVGDGSGAGTSCSVGGMTRSCCGIGTQTCNGTTEFKLWSECLDAKGKVLTCPPMNTPCGPGEFGPTCTTPPPTLDAGSSCGAGEFGANCGGPMPMLCTDQAINNEPEILQGYQPASGQSVSQNGQIKVWITDERSAIVAPGEQVDANTGMITAPGDRTAKAPDGYLWEPALYIAPQTAENGGTPHFPAVIKGWYNNNPPAGGQRPPAGAGVQVPGIEPAPPGSSRSLMYDTEYVWNVADLGLAPGTYVAEFVIHDGDRDRGVGCVTIVITP